MTSKKNAAQVAAQAEPCQDFDEQPLNVHATYQQQSDCGYVRALTLNPHEVQSITARLRGISAISALFIAAGDREALKLGEWMEGGLNDALHALAEDAYSILEHRNSCAQKEAR